MLEIMNAKINETAITSDALNTVTSEIKTCLDNIKANTLRIGYYLTKVRDNKLYEGQGFENEVEYGMVVFNFKKTAIYSFMKLADKFLDREGNFKYPEFEEYSPSQLEAMASIGANDAKKLIDSGKVSSEMSVKDVKAVVKDSKPTKNGKVVKTENQKSAAQPHDTMLYKINIGIDSLGNPFLTILDNTGETAIERRSTKTKAEHLQEYTELALKVISEQAEIIKEENALYLKRLNMNKASDISDMQ